MGITVKCQGRCDHVFSFTPKARKDEAVSHVVDHYIAQMLTMIMPDVDASHDQKFQMYEYMAASYRRELMMRQASNASFRTEDMHDPILELLKDQDESKSSRPHPPEASLSGDGKRIVTRPRGSKSIRGGRHRHMFSSEPLLHEELPLQDSTVEDSTASSLQTLSGRASNRSQRAYASDPLPHGNLPLVINGEANAAQHPELDSSDDSIHVRLQHDSVEVDMRPQRLNACDVSLINISVC
eukprot:TRINITY_DN11690_c0_g1_i3.p1 TRINITY_DN11690_c0_g1~~TRINITY_DN11690_c0_g1_i3.p1  ORF type:complete len:240 (-),score=40.34 TRINITY_DN11690_c0_g1_i3:271-990(-)